MLHKTFALTIDILACTSWLSLNLLIFKMALRVETQTVISYFLDWYAADLFLFFVEMSTGLHNVLKNESYTQKKPRRK